MGNCSKKIKRLKESDENRRMIKLLDGLGFHSMSEIPSDWKQTHQTGKLYFFVDPWFITSKIEAGKHTIESIKETNLQNVFD